MQPMLHHGATGMNNSSAPTQCVDQEESNLNNMAHMCIKTTCYDEQPYNPSGIKHLWQCNAVRPIAMQLAEVVQVQQAQPLLTRQ